MAKIEKAKSKKKSEEVSKEAKKPTASESRLAKLESPKVTRDLCVAFDMREVRTAVGQVIESLSMARDGSTGDSEVVVMFALDTDVNKKTGIGKCHVIFARAGGSARTQISCRVFHAGDGSFVAPASLFRAVGGDTLTLTVDLNNNALGFKCSVNGSLQLPTTVEEYSMLFPHRDSIPKTKYELPSFVVNNIATKLMFPSFDPSLPLLGLPLHILVKKKKMRLTSNDSIVGALYSFDDSELEDIDVVLPGQALLVMSKISKADSLRLGFSESLFRMTVPGVIDVIHPTGIYDIIDMRGFLASDEKQKPDFEVVLPTAAVIDAINGVMGLSALDRGEGKILLEFGDIKSGRATFKGNVVSNARKAFPIVEVPVKGRVMEITTDGRRLTSFLSILKEFPRITVRVRNSRAFLMPPDQSYVFMLPLA